MVTRAAFYFRNLFQLMQNGSATEPGLLEDYPNCGIRNNDTFSGVDAFGPSFTYILYGGEATADWSAECLWDCTWKENPYVGRKKRYKNTKNARLQLYIQLTMPKVPVDLSCLNNCTDKGPPISPEPPSLPVYFDENNEPLDCGNSSIGSFLACYLYYSTRSTALSTNYLFVSSTYFHMAVESCILAELRPSLYIEGNCDQLRVNLRFFNPYVYDQSGLSNSIPSMYRIQGSATGPVTAFAGFLGINQLPIKNRYPWLCSLRTFGYRGYHRCGVTLLSAPPRPTIFVSSAHCNYLCKNENGRLVEMCCCRDPFSVSSCRSSDFCGTSNSLQPAAPEDLQVVCNIRSQETRPNGFSFPNATVLQIKEIRNHPGYLPGEGPIEGSDICVYIVDDSKLADWLNLSSLWPACLPQTKEDSYIPGNRGTIAGWKAPTSFNESQDLQGYVNDNLVLREALLEGTPCADPAWMKSNTYYPPGTVCYTEAAWAGAVTFGISGSGLMRPFTYSNSKEAETRYRWDGPLSPFKGSDLSTVFPPHIIYYSSNPAVFTDARCYLDWIAAQFGLTLPAGYAKPASCDKSNGDKAAQNNTNCLSRNIYRQRRNPETCAFTSTFPKCTYNDNFNGYYCKSNNSEAAICANDCPGVDPNAVVVGGITALVSLAAGASLVPNLVSPALGAAVSLAGLGLGSYAMTRSRVGTCPAGQCRAQLDMQCCRVVVINGRQQCPLNC